ncbi:MAG: FIST C-terminal domain-containing protein [Oscillospiraceae bacterium]|nr:FIST C-terminal domain-containing protein [Oscillospiraceae bacterium]
MLKCASVYTYEIDAPEIALGEIKSQLEKKITLLENSVGIIMCNPEFITSGVVAYISENLPFDLAGVTTASQAVNNEAGELILTIFVMTSDDTWFKSGVTGDLEDEIDGPVIEAVEKAAAGMPGMPKLALIFPPLILKNSGDAYINACKQVLPAVPIFGTVTIDDTLTFEGSETIYNGKNYKYAMPFVLCYGNINPRFLIGTLPDDKVMPYRGEITKSSGPFVQEINNINAFKYFESIGFISNGALAENFLFVPFIIDQKKREDYDGIPVVRGHAAFMENGTAIFRGDVDEGSTFTLLTCGPDEVMLTTQQKIEQLNEMPDINGAILFPCIVRRMMTQRVGPLTELELIRKIINPEIPYMMGYAGGEICPTSVKNGVPTNRFHNYSLIILIL